MRKEEVSLESLESIILELKKHRILSGVQLSIRTGLSLTTISKTVAELRKKGFIIESVSGKEGYEYIAYARKRLNRKLTKNEKKWLIESYKQYKKMSDILAIAGTTKTTVYSILKKNKVMLRAEEGESYKDIFVDMYKEGYELKEIAKKTDKSFQFVKQNIYKFVDPDRRGR